MMRYFLNLFNDADVRDEEGEEYPDLPHAKQAAVEAARGLIAEHVLSGRAINLDHRIEVTGTDGQVLAAIPFREVVTISDSGATDSKPSLKS